MSGSCKKASTSNPGDSTSPIFRCRRSLHHRPTTYDQSLRGPESPEEEAEKSPLVVPAQTNPRGHLRTSRRQRIFINWGRWKTSRRGRWTTSQPGLLDEAVPFTGSRFEYLAGGGDRQAVANAVTADDLIAVQTLSVGTPAQVAVARLKATLASGCPSR
ncbi:DUF6308 family protein [Streptomyces caniscabiei]|uniref:DUF6308 family protein n=1 Tax=Streptomyces caniscabiei TaxID=2746961 RepID=UPI0038F74E54